MSVQSRTLRLLGYGLLFLLAVAAGVAAGAPGMVERLGERVHAKLERALDVDIEVAEVDWTLGGTLTLEGLVVRPQGEGEDEPALLVAEKVTVRSDLSVFRQKAKLTQIDVQGATVSVVRRADGSVAALETLEALRALVAPPTEGGSGGGSGGGLSRFLVRHIPDVHVGDLKVIADAGSLSVPEGLALPTRIELSRGEVFVHNTALLKEEDNLTIKARFADTSLDPGFGLTVETTVTLAGGNVPVEVRFDRPARVMVGRRVAALGALSWDGSVAQLEDVALSVPLPADQMEGDPVDPAVRVARVKLIPGEDVGLAELKAALATSDKTAAVKALIRRLERIELVRPALVFERRPDGEHNFSDLLGKGPDKAPEAPVELAGPDKALGALMEATTAASQRLMGKAKRAADGAKFRGFLVRGFSRLERSVDRLSELATRGAERFVLNHLVVKGGHFVWRDGSLTGGEASIRERLENFDLDARRDGDVLTFETSFVMPGSSRKANVVDGKVHLGTGDVQLHARLGHVKLWPYRQIFPASMPVSKEMAVMDTDLTLLWSPASEIARIEGDLHIQDAAFEMKSIASETMGGMDVTLSFGAQLDRKHKTVVLRQSRFQLGKAPMVVRFDAASYDTQPKLTGVIRLERSRCQDVVDSLPKQVIPMLEGLEVTGTIGWQLDFSLDTADMESLVYHSYPQLSDFRVVNLGKRLNMDAVRGTFLHRIVEADGTVREMLMGPGAPRWASIGQISPYMVKAVTTTEDGSFFKHSGFSEYAIRQSLITNLKKGRFVRGASTITQQLVKNLFLSREKTLSRKAQEMFITWQIENALSKQRIMELYLNIIEWGPGIYGVTRASEHYFGKHPSELSALEAVFLASLIPSPKQYYHQFKRGEVTDGWKRHLRWIMQVMVKRGKISELEYLAAAPYSPVFRGQDSADPAFGDGQLPIAIP